GKRAPEARADDIPRRYRRELFSVGQSMLPADHKLVALDPFEIDGQAILPFEDLLMAALADEAANPSYENRPDSVNDPRSRREVIDPETNARKIEYSAKRSFIEDLSRPGRRV